MSGLGPWRQGDLPHPPAYNLRNLVRVVGPGAILLGVSIGAGDWLLGPAVVARHGAALLWLCTLSVLLQAVLNTEMARYTLATGEPVFTGFMRTPPGARFWAWTYSLLHLGQTGWAGWALGAGSALAALFLGRPPREEDRGVVLALGYVFFLTAVGLVLLGDRGHRALERLEGALMAWILLLLLGIALGFLPWRVWWSAGAGFAGLLPAEPWLPGGADGTGLDWVLLAAFAAYSGAGGTLNATLTHWLRDKGFGMAGPVGVVPTPIGARLIPLAREGVIFPPTAENLAKWRQWWRYLRADLWYLWTAGCLAGMALPVLLALGFVPPGAEMGGPGAGAALAQAVGEQAGLLLGALALAAGCWILFATQLGVAEGFARSVTDILWAGGVRAPAAVLYPGVLGIFTAAGAAALTLADPLRLVLIGASVAALNFALLAFHTLWLNRRLLPRELRPSLASEAVVLLCGLFFAALVALAAARPGRLLGRAGA